MSSFTPRSWKSQAEPHADRVAEPTVEAPRAPVKTNNLPIIPTAFIGREHDVAEVKTLLSEHSLVTLVGSGGVGKTRLAVRVGSELLEAFADGVWFVDLAPIADPELVSSVVAQTLGMSQQEGRRVDESIPLWLERKQLLLVFDNCEHVLQTVASIAAAIIRTAPDVRVIATSRQGLNIDGEAAVRVASLDVPHTIADVSASAVVEFAAVALFVSRATLADRSFVLTDDTAPIVADICRRLDGIPLAIELAAARVKVLSIPHLAQRLNERFKLLTGGSRSALPRQQTLHALLDWSYDLLTEPEQHLFARLGIFAGGFALDAATSVCGGDGLDELEILDLLGSLTDKSLVVADTSGQRERYRLLESTAAYALEKLRATDEHDAQARRHAQYFREEAEAAYDARSSTCGSTPNWLAGVELELDNYRSALTWALTQGNDAVVGGAIAGALGGLWTGAGLAVEGRYWVELALGAVSEDEQPLVAARLLGALGGFFSGRRKHDAAERAMRLYAAVDDSRGAARAQADLAFALAQMGECDAAQATIAEALAATRACGDVLNLANALNIQAMIDKEKGDPDAAREGFAQALADAKTRGDVSMSAVVLGNLAELEFANGHPEQALQFLSEALEIVRLGKNASDIAIHYVNTAAYRLALGELDGAREAAREALRAARQARDELVIAVALQHLGLLAARSGDGRRAATLLGYVDARYAELGNKREITEQWGYDELLVALREVLKEDEIAQLSAEGATWSEDRAVEEALKS
jgi:predicted ATPase/Tfp pilus assembly protein PilF